MSGVKCQVSGVTCHMFFVFLFFCFFYKKFYNVVELVGGGSVINGASPV